MRNPKPPTFSMTNEELDSKITFKFFNLVVDPVKVSNTVDRFWNRHKSRLDPFFSGKNFLIEVYAYDNKTIAYLVDNVNLDSQAVSKATVREGDTYNATIGAEVAITSLLRKVINKDLRKISNKDMKIAQKAYDQWLQSEKYNCGNPNCEACNTAMGMPVKVKAKLTSKGILNKEYKEEFVANLEYTTGDRNKVTIDEVNKQLYSAEIKTRSATVVVLFESQTGGRDIDRQVKIIDAVREAMYFAPTANYKKASF